MRPLETASPSVRRAIVAGISLYFALLVYARLANDLLARTAANLVFGGIAIGVGALLFGGWRAGDGRPLPAIAGACLVVGGLVQVVSVVTGTVVLDLLATAAVFVGVLAYLLAVWTGG